MNFISLFSGIGGFDLGFERAGLTCAAQVEWDQDAAAVLARHFPNVERFGDVRDVGKHNLPAVDLVCGGFPCQDVSVAGRRAGLAGERSGLWFEFHRVLAELTPQWVVIENVPGLLSSNAGRDFATILHGLVELRYGVCWRVLDAQHFGVPQRRRRVFIVGSLGDGRAAEILFERESGGGDFAPGGKAGQDVAYALRASPSHSGDKGDGGINTTLIAKTLTSNYGKQPDSSDSSTPGNFVVANTLTRREFAQQSDATYVTGTLAASGAGSARPAGQKNETDMLVFMAGQGAKAGSIAASDTLSPTLKGASSGTNQVPSVVYGLATTVTPKYGVDLAPTLTVPSPSGGGQPPAMASLAQGVRRLTPVECERLQGFPPIFEWRVDMMTRDEFAIALLASGAVVVDAETGRVFVTRGAGGIRLLEQREVEGSDCNGYLVASFRLGDSRKQLRLHRLIWMSVHGIIPEGYVIHHQNHEKQDNRIENLQLVTAAENSHLAALEGQYPVGEDNRSTKLTPEIARQIADDYQHGEWSLRQLAERYGISKSRVHQIVQLSGWTAESALGAQSDSKRYRQLGNAVAVPVAEWLGHRLMAVRP